MIVNNLWAKKGIEYFKDIVVGVIWTITTKLKKTLILLDLL